MNHTQKPKRNDAVDALRLIAAFLVVLVHFPLDLPTGWYQSVIWIGRTCVPIFILISGYLLGRAPRPASRCLKQFPGILRTAVLGSLLHPAFYLSYYQLSGKTGYIEPYLREMSRERFIDWLVFSDPIYGSHLWYLFAYAYALLLMAFLLRWSPAWFQASIAAVTMVMYLALGRYSFLFFGENLNTKYARCFLVSILPQLILGYFIGKYQKKALRPALLRVLLFGSIGMLLIEGRLTSLVSVEIQNGAHQYFFNVVCGVILLEMAMAWPVTEHSILTEGIVEFLGRLGRKYSLTIYVVQYIIYTVVYTLLAVYWENTEYAGWIQKNKPLVIFLSCLLFAIVYVNLKLLLLGALKKIFRRRKRIEERQNDDGK